MSKEDTPAIFAVIDEYEDIPGGGIKPKRQFREAFPFINREAYTDENHLLVRAIAKSIVPTRDGLYIIEANDEYYKLKVASMEKMAKKYPQIKGPFGNRQDAIEAQFKLRKQTQSEQNVSLKSTVDTQNAELAELKAKLAAIEKHK